MQNTSDSELIALSEAYSYMIFVSSSTENIRDERKTLDKISNEIEHRVRSTQDTDRRAKLLVALKEQQLHTWRMSPSPKSRWIDRNITSIVNSFVAKTAQQQTTGILTADILDVATSIIHLQLCATVIADTDSDDNDILSAFQPFVTHWQTSFNENKWSTIPLQTVIDRILLIEAYHQSKAKTLSNSTAGTHIFNYFIPTILQEASDTNDIQLMMSTHKLLRAFHCFGTSSNPYYGEFVNIVKTKIEEAPVSTMATVLTTQLLADSIETSIMQPVLP